MIIEKSNKQFGELPFSEETSRIFESGDVNFSASIDDLELTVSILP